MKTAIYTICKDEINRIERWLQYANQFDYICILDTGSTDGTWEYLVEHVDTDKWRLSQKSYSDFTFDAARNLNLKMIPSDTDWCLSADIDEWFSINVIDEIKNIVEKHPDVTSIATTRLDIYSDEVFIGPPNHTPSNKIHRYGAYYWKQPIYEHLWPYNLDRHVEIFSDKIYLIHDQDTSKPRSTLYPKLMKERFNSHPEDCWNNWYLLNHYYRERDQSSYIEVALCYLKYSKTFDDKFKAVYNDIKNIFNWSSIDHVLSKQIEKVLEDVSSKIKF